MDENISSLDPRRIDALKVHRGPLTRKGLFNGLIVNLQVSDLPFETGRENLNPIPYGEGTRNQGSGHHGSKTFHDKDTINGQPE